MALIPLTPIEKLHAAKIKIRTSFPFVSYLASQLNLIDDTSIQTACINAKFVMKYNGQFIASKTSPEIQWLLAHELFHIVLGHLTYTSKIPSFNADKWNIACDLKVNDTLETEGIGQPIMGALLPTTNHEFTLQVTQHTVTNIDTKSALEIYDEIDDVDVQAHAPASHASGDHESSDSSDEQSDQKAADRHTAQADMAGGRGLKSAALRRAVDRILNPKVDWRERLHRFAQQFLPSKQTWARANKRFLANGISFPGMLKEQIDIVFAIDTSGSITDEMIQMPLKEMRNIVSAFDNVNIHVLVGDSDLCGEFDVKDDDSVNEVQATGGGGTSHVFVYEYCKEHMPQCCIMFTDGYSDLHHCEQNIGMECAKMFIAPEGMSAIDLMKQYGDVIELPVKEGDEV